MKSLLLLALLSFGIYASEDKQSLVVQINPVLVQSNDPEVCTIMYTNQRFMIIKEHEVVPLDKADIDENLSKIHTCKDLAEYLSHGNALKVIKNEQGDYRIESLLKLKGGGPISGACVYLGIKVVAYTSMMLGGMAAQAAAPGAGTVAVGIALGTGGMTGALVGIEALSVKWGCAVALMPWCP